jgi:hypothetical protein
MSRRRRALFSIASRDCGNRMSRPTKYVKKLNSLKRLQIIGAPLSADVTFDVNYTNILTCDKKYRPKIKCKYKKLRVKCL